MAVSACAFGETLPPDAAALQAMRDKRVAEIDRIYVAELEKLQKKHMKDGALDAANRIAEEIKKIMPDPFVESPIVGKWKRDSDGTIFEFKNETSGIFEGSTPFKVVQDPDTKVMNIKSSQWVDTVMLTSDPHTLAGKNSKGVAYTLTRIK